MPATREEYETAFRTEAANVYPNITEFEKRCGRAIHPDVINGMAKILACPVKANPPNWQHGRVLYAEARRYLMADGHISKVFCFVDIGTAKGFSALCMAHAINDAGVVGKVLTYDVIDPHSREPRNAPTDTLPEIPDAFELVAQFRPQRVPIFLFGANERPTTEHRINFAFIDGKHSYESVKNDMGAMSIRQQRGDVIVFDDLQIEGVARAVAELSMIGLGRYEIEALEAHPGRRYAIARRVT